MNGLRCHNGLILIFLPVFVVLFFTLKCSCFADDMRPLYTQNKALMPRLQPKIYTTGKIEIRGLFDVPVDNAVATNRIGDAIIQIYFDSKKVKYKIISHGGLDYVSAGREIHLPIFSEDQIAYSMGRGFLLFNMKRHDYRYYSIAGNFDYSIFAIDVVDSEKNIFLFSISLGIENGGALMRLVDLSAEEMKIINEKRVESGEYVTSRNMLFFYDKDILKAFDMNFVEVSHPLVKSFNKQKKQDFGEIREIAIHPLFPFAVIRESRKKVNSFERVETVWVVTWRESGFEGNGPLMCKLFESGSTSFKFSYDGKWLCFFELSCDHESYTLMPVKSGLPVYIGRPIKLGDIEKCYGRALTRNPSGLVVSECVEYGKKYQLKKWNFSEAEELL